MRTATASGDRPRVTVTLTAVEAKALLLAITELQNGEPDGATAWALSRAENKIRAARRRPAA